MGVVAVACWELMYMRRAIVVCSTVTRVLHLDLLFGAQEVSIAEKTGAAQGNLGPWGASHSCWQQGSSGK